MMEGKHHASKLHHDMDGALMRQRFWKRFGHQISKGQLWVMRYPAKPICCAHFLITFTGCLEVNWEQNTWLRVSLGCTVGTLWQRDLCCGVGRQHFSSGDQLFPSTTQSLRASPDSGVSNTLHWGIQAHCLFTSDFTALWTLMLPDITAGGIW